MLNDLAKEILRIAVKRDPNLANKALPHRVRKYSSPEEWEIIGRDWSVLICRCCGGGYDQADKPWLDLAAEA